jgi:hypothetical protein
MDSQVRHAVWSDVARRSPRDATLSADDPERYAVDPQVAAAVPREARPAGACFWVMLTSLCPAAAGAAGPSPGPVSKSRSPRRGGVPLAAQAKRPAATRRARPTAERPLRGPNNRGLGVPGREKDLHEVVISGNQYPVLPAGPLQDHQVISARQPYLTDVNGIVPSCLQMSADR